MKRRFMGSKHKDAGYMKVVALEDGLTVSFSNPLEYSFDEITWQSLPANTGTQAINKDQYVAFRANLKPAQFSGIGTFSIDKQCDLKGNCMSLFFGDEFSDKNDLTGYNYAFYNLFSNQSNIKSVDSGFLPATKLADYCYYNMFKGCTSLSTAPDLPAASLDDSCYYNMFVNCTSLTTAPELPATTLANNCYSSMFYGCSSLTTAPELPATTLAGQCYSNMFSNCTSLTVAPELPATTLTDYCYSGMFYGCKSLTTVPTILPATTLDSYCYNQMFRDCINLTTAPELPATTLDSNCYNNMFSRCSSLTTAPELPATTLANGCYSEMFKSCTSLTTAPELPATTLAEKCYQYMFSDCTGLTTAPELPATTLASNCYYQMFYNCRSLTTAPKLPATTLDSNCYNNMFYGCTSLTSAPELPATTLADSCYSSMFSGCTNLTAAPTILPATTLNSSCYKQMFSGCRNLTTAPELTATTLVSNCYSQMFYNCKNLNYIKALFTTEPGSAYTNNWVYGVSSTGTFVKSKDATWDVTGANGVPNGWTVEIESDDPIDYEFIDLGLPSGTKWSTRNLGASDVNDVGLYYQNGGEQGYKVETEYVNSGTFNIVSSEPDGFDFSTYNISEFKDAANIINKDMSIPSVGDWEELANNGTFAYDGTNTVYTSNINGNTIIFPRNLILENGKGILEKTPFCFIAFSIHAENAFCVYDTECMGATTESVNDLLEFQIQSGMPIRPVTKVG